MLPIISGKYSGRHVPVYGKFTDRPTMTKVRAAIFNALCSLIDFSSIKVLDLFCGTGIFSFESVSRGAEKAYLVDNNRDYLYHIKTLADSFGIDEFDFICCNASKLPKASNCCDIVFLDPPFTSDFVNNTLISLISSEWISKETILLAECSIHENIDEALKYYKMLRYKKYGSTLSYMLSPA